MFGSDRGGCESDATLDHRANEQASPSSNELKGRVAMTNPCLLYNLPVLLTWTQKSRLGKGPIASEANANYSKSNH